MQTGIATQEIPSLESSSNYSSKLKLKEKISYGFGDLGSNLMWGIIGSFLLYFYTDVALIPVAATGTIMLVARVLDAVIDPVIGGFVDRTNTRMGRTRPYILFGIIPLAVMLVLTFTSPDISVTGRIAYASITYIIAGLLYSLVNVPYGALMPLMTRSSEEKNELSSFRMLGMAVGNIAVTALTTPLVNFFGNGDEHQGYMLTTIVFAVFSSLTFLVVFKNCKERYVEQAAVASKKEKGQLIATYKSAFKNGPWVATLVFSLLMFIKIGAVVAITIYFCIHVLDNPKMISVLLPLMYVSMLISAAIAPAILKKFKHRKGNMLALIIYVIGIAFMPLFKENMTMFVVLWFVANMFGGISSGAVFGMTADSVDYNEWKFNKRSEGTLYAGYSFATKVGMAIGGAAIGYVLAFSGYNATEITPQAVSSINILYFSVPIICSLLQMVALSFYKLDAIHPQVVRELEQRRTVI